jgi:lipopolysaccharide/colanic/teichoic acid biosynthesis glycosyltransferase
LIAKELIIKEFKKCKIAIISTKLINKDIKVVIVFGNEYEFTEYELDRLKRFTIKYVKTIEEVEDNLKRDKTKLVILNRKNSDFETIQYFSNLTSKGVHFLTLEHFMERYLQKCYIPKDGGDLHYLEDIKPFSTWQYFQKRFIDYFGVFWLLLFSFPVMIYSSYRIRKESPEGSIFFKQKRVGSNGDEFVCLKFRSMHIDSHFDPYTRKNDSRIFPFAEKMRKYRLDELPQIWNILKGDMHLIGPRAEWNILVPNYRKELPFYDERSLVKPGITGHAQVNYPYGANIEDTRQKLMYDLYYIKYWNLRLELKIVWKTAMTVLRKRGI